MGVVNLILPRLVEVDGRVFDVRPPTVREALVLLFAGPSALQGDVDSERAVMATLRGWYPPELMAVLNGRGLPKIMDWAVRITNEGYAGSNYRKNTGKRADQIDWPSCFASYITMYGDTYDGVMSMPWDGFLAMMGEIGKQKAMRTLELVNAYTIPQMADKNQRMAAIAQLKADAGLKPFEEVDEDTGMKNLDSMAAELAMVGSFFGGGKNGNA